MKLKKKQDDKAVMALIGSIFPQKKGLSPGVERLLREADALERLTALDGVSPAELHKLYGAPN